MALRSEEVELSIHLKQVDLGLQVGISCHRSALHSTDMEGIELVAELDDSEASIDGMLSLPLLVPADRSAYCMIRHCSHLNPHSVAWSRCPAEDFAMTEENRRKALRGGGG